MLPRDEYIEQAYFFNTLHNRMEDGYSTQEMLHSVRQEILATTLLPYAIDFMADELKMTGGFSTAMARLPHYFTTFQTHVIAESEKDSGRFDFQIAVQILEKEAEFRAEEPSIQGVFLYQFEAICRNRLGYDSGLEAMAGDPIYDEDWKEWIRTVRRQIGLIDFCDMIYVRSAQYKRTEKDPDKPVLFGEKEGRIAFANRKKDPIYLFSALQRHLSYPSVPRPKKEDTQKHLLPMLQQQVDRLETRLRLMEEEMRGGINIARHYASDNGDAKE